LIPYYSKKQVLDDFDDEDRIMLSKKKDEKTFDLGEIDLSKSTKSELYLSLNKKSKGINIGDLLYLQTKLSKSSFSRRKRAMERLLDRLSVVPNLMDYFDENCDKAPQDFSPPPTEEDFSVYERELPNGQMIGLNDAQKKAFSRLISRGPLGLLQGPPGTGKTEFIAAFCHYLIAQQGVKNILLVSQSHEAVNTAAERIRSHCRRLQTDLDVVRFSNREQAVSEELKDVYSKSIVTRQQNSFRAEIKQRFSLMAPSLGVSSLFIECLIDIQRSVGSLVKGINRIRADFSPDDEKHNAQLERSLQTMRTELFSELRSNYDIASNAESNVDDLLNQVYTLVAGQHGVRTHELNRCLSLISLTNELIDRISSDRANYDEFLTRSRTLVCGTCVGIGLGHLKLAENRFDWVIIDEAARSSPTELAIAMQVGHRVLLVGDHRQLPPTYEEEHQKAIARTLGIHHRSPDLQLIMRSDFERAFDSPYGKLVNATLKTQYRMQPAIGQLVSEVFYSGDLETGSRPIPQYFNSPPEIIKPVVTWLDTGALGKKAHHPEKKGNSLINPAEADCIINLLKIIEGDIDFSGCLIEESSKSQEPAIGIICMYSDQKKHIRKKFAENSWSEDFKRIVKIDTVDSYQGKENRVVIVSLTRSDVEHSPGFLVSPNRINVAMSRAMDRLIIVGDMRVWGGRNASLPLGRVATYIRDRQHEDSYSITSAHNLKGAM
jgi:hypothetical protein